MSTDAKRMIIPHVVASATNLTKIYGEGDTAVTAVRNVSVEFGKRSLTAIMGASGSGKSTLMHCLAGLDRPSSGSVFIGGEDITQMDDQTLTKLRRERVGFIFQAFNLLPALTAKQNILLPLELAGRKPDRDQFDSLVSKLGIVDRLGHHPSELSGGEQQRVAVARALITNPDIIFADEPTGALDKQNSKALLEFLNSAVDDLGYTIIMVTHDARAASYADRVLTFQDGEIVDEIENPDTEATMAAMKRLGN